MNSPIDNSGLANTFGVAAIVAGGAGAFLPVSTSTVLTRAFPGFYSELWFFGLFMCGMAVFIGSRLQRVEGPNLVAVGLGVGACFLTSYGVLLVVNAGPPSFTAATFVFSLAGICYVRVRRMRQLNRAIRSSLRDKGD